MEFHRTYSGAEWERKYGYSRAMRTGHLVFVGGTSPVTDSGGVFEPGNAYAQARRCYEIIEASLAELGVGKLRIVRSRMFVTDMSKADQFGRAHADYFGEHRPCLTLVGVSSLIDPEMLIEIEAEAVVPNRR